MSEITFKVNEFRTYEVRRDGISLGFIDTATGGYIASLGETFQYDGTTLILKDGREFSDAPQLRSAIRSGWCSLREEVPAVQRPQPAGIQVRATTQVGFERPVKTIPQTQRAEEDVVVSVEDRRKRREAVNEEASRRVPLQSAEARQALASASSSQASDPEVSAVLGLLDAERNRWLSENGQLPDPRAQAEEDIRNMLAGLEGTPGNLSSASAEGARSLPVVRPETYPSLPIVSEDLTENAGRVVGSVVERDSEFELNVAPAKPPAAPRPVQRFGGTGAIIVDEQRHMGDIALSSQRAPIQIDESAKVIPSSTDSIKMGEVQVGDRRKQASRILMGDQEGVAVGRVLSPTKRSFVADASNTSASAIEREAEGKQLRVEKFAVEKDENYVQEPTAVTATGDVQESRVGDNLEDLLPDAAKSPTPVVHRRPEEDPAYAAVRMMIPGFEWNKDRRIQDRVEEALKHYKNPMYVKGILAVETPTAQEAIKKALAGLIAKSKKKSSKKVAKKA